MTKKTIDPPPHILFSKNYSVIENDLQPEAGHMLAERYPAIAMATTSEYMHSKGFKGAKGIEGVSLILKYSEIAYFSETWRGDLLRVDLGLAHLGGKSFELVFDFRHAGSGSEICRVKNTFVCFDYENKRAAAVPDSLQAALLKAE